MAEGLQTSMDDKEQCALSPAMTFFSASTCDGGEERILTIESLEDFEHLCKITDEVVTIFDWDDTLCPSHYIRSAVEPCLKGARSISPDSPIYGPLCAHAGLVAATLRAARAIGKVAIVTLAQRGWVHDSAARFLPGLDLQVLLDELDIPVYYAFEHVHKSVARLIRMPRTASRMRAQGTDVQKGCKRAAMEKCLRRMWRKRHVRLNVISIGDSTAERDAIKEIMWFPACAGLPSLEHLCKTIKLAEDPTLEELGGQLRSLSSWLPKMVDCLVDADIDLAAEVKHQ